MSVTATANLRLQTWQRTIATDRSTRSRCGTGWVRSTAVLSRIRASRGTTTLATNAQKIGFQFMPTMRVVLGYQPDMSGQPGQAALIDGMSTTWFTSDLHLGHDAVAAMRGFADPGDHDAAVLDAIRSRVGPRDTLWVLGDLALSGLTSALTAVAALPGAKHLVFGNHDGGHPMHRRSSVLHHRYLDAFASVQSAATRKLGGTTVLLSHFPYSGDHTEVQRYPQWRLRDCGVPVLHGHTHSSEQVSASTDGTPQIHVGLDAWGLAPVRLDDVLDLLGSTR